MHVRMYILNSQWYSKYASTYVSDSSSLTVLGFFNIALKMHVLVSIAVNTICTHTYINMHAEINN